MPNKMILTAGPEITNAEIELTMDAVKNGWNEHCYDYIYKFHDEFSKYLGAKHTITVSGGTQALTLGLATMGIKEGDEVIIPELTYYACSDVIKLLGATPVFVDILPDTWTIDPKKMEAAITSKTKAIMPVSMYGNPVEADTIKYFARHNGLLIIEDGCQGLGAEYRGVKTGNLFDMTAFSFQGAKIMTCGFGGALTINDDYLYEKACWLNDHCEDKGNKFWQSGIGYEFALSNIQCAFLLGQLSHLDNMVKKKRLIFSWYQERLEGLDIRINYEKENTKNSYWMTSIIVKKDREKVMTKLKEKGIDTRPFFYPISVFPMYEKQPNPVAYDICFNGINLPSGVMLTEDKVDYICATLKKILS